MEALGERLQRPVDGLHVAVQGLGAVGSGLCERLAARGARLTVCDAMSERAAAAADRFGAEIVEPAAITRTHCDVFAPCALGGVLTTDVAQTLPALGVCGGANNVFAEPQAARVLHRRGIIAVPDFVANAGALILGALWHLTGERVPPERVQQIGATTREVLGRAAEADLPPSELALEMARERVERAATGS
jgi:leucine dehydrogenase